MFCNEISSCLQFEWRFRLADDSEFLSGQKSNWEKKKQSLKWKLINELVFRNVREKIDQRKKQSVWKNSTFWRYESPPELVCFFGFAITLSSCSFLSLSLCPSLSVPFSETTKFFSQKSRTSSSSSQTFDLRPPVKDSIFLV